MNRCIHGKKALNLNVDLGTYRAQSKKEKKTWFARRLPYCHIILTTRKEKHESYGINNI